MSIEQDVIEIVAEKLSVDPSEVTPEKHFINDLNADSLDLTEIVMDFEEKFSCEIPTEDQEKLKTVGDVINYVKQHQEA